MLSDETKAALQLVTSLCDYMIDDGELDLAEDLQIIHDEACKISNGEYGRVRDDALTDERRPIISEILINVANMWAEIQDYWEWMAENGQVPDTPAPQAAQVEASQAMPSATQTPTAAGQADEAGQEPEAATPKPLPTDLPSGDLPPVLDTPKARRVFGKAIEKGYMKKLLSGGFEWNGVTETGRNVQLAYLCGKIYGYHYTQKGNTGTQFPESELSDTFALENLQTSLFNFYDRPAKRRQKWIDKLDELLD